MHTIIQKSEDKKKNENGSGEPKEELDCNEQVSAPTHVRTKEAAMRTKGGIVCERGAPLGLYGASLAPHAATSCVSRARTLLTHRTSLSFRRFPASCTTPTAVHVWAFRTPW